MKTNTHTKHRILYLLTFTHLFSFPKKSDTGKYFFSKFEKNYYQCMTLLKFKVHVFIQINILLWIEDLRISPLSVIGVLQLFMWFMVGNKLCQIMMSKSLFSGADFEAFCSMWDDANCEANQRFVSHLNPAQRLLFHGSWFRTLLVFDKGFP